MCMRGCAWAVCVRSDAALQNHNHKAPKPRAHLRVRKHYSRYFTKCCNPLVTEKTICISGKYSALSSVFFFCFFFSPLFANYTNEHVQRSPLCCFLSIWLQWKAMFGVVASIDRFLCGFIVTGVNLGDSRRRSQSSCTHQLCSSWNVLHL